jgi:hypothetical protein
MQASEIAPRTSSASPRAIRCTTSSCAPRQSCGSTLTASRSFKRAGSRKSSAARRTANVTPCSRSNAASGKPSVSSHSVRARSM